MKKLLWIALAVVATAVATAGTALLAEPVLVQTNPPDPPQLETRAVGGEFRLDGGIARSAARVSSGGGWTLSQAVTAIANPSLGFSLLADPASSLAKAAGGCLCGGVFSDGFESGDTSAWSITAPFSDPQ